jgi:hypothetical protein
MHRHVLFGLLLFSSTAALCQSAATAHENSQAPGKPSGTQWPLDFSNGQVGLTAGKPALKSFDCHVLNTTANQPSAPIDLDHLFDTACTGLKWQAEPPTHVELFARNEHSLSRFPFGGGSHLKSEPIPTQWPNAKVERIPTEWPNLKLQPIDGGSQGLVPAHSSAK